MRNVTSNKRYYRSGDSYRNRYYKKRRRYNGNKYSTKRIIPAGIARNLTINRSNGVMPERFITRHKYIVPINFTTVGGISTVQAYRGNGIYDPDQTGVGVVATGFATMATMYSYHRVYASSFKATVQCTGNMGVIYSVLPSRTSTSIQYLAAKSYPNYKEIVLGDHSGPSTRTIYHFVKTGQFMDLQSREKDLMANGNNNPGEQWYWMTLATSIDTTTNTECTGVMEITYYTEWSGLKTIA